MIVGTGFFRLRIDAAANENAAADLSRELLREAVVTWIFGVGMLFVTVAVLGASLP